VRPALERAYGQTIIWSPPFRFGRSKKQVQNDFYAFGRTLKKPRKEIDQAVAAAEKAQNEVTRKFREAGAAFLKDLKGRALVLVSRPYNGCDPGLNLNLPRRLRDLGVLALPMEFLPLDDIDISTDHVNMYWKYGHKILRAAEFIRHHEHLCAVYLSNFACGPDSFISHYVQEKMAGKPYLAIEIDEHNADAGVVTRCEAFLDSLAHAAPQPRPVAPHRTKTSPVFNKTIYIPYMSDHAFAVSAAFRAFGTKAEVLPASDDRSLELGRKHSSGRECFPFIITCGDILRQVATPGFDAAQSAFLMPAANGPCRFGQYHKMHRTILEQLGYHNVEMLSPNSKYSYNNMMSAQFRNRAWRGILAIEALEKALRKLRPYELQPGSIDQAYQAGLRELENAIADQTASISGALTRVKHSLAAVPTDRSVLKPVVGMVGEIFLRSHAFSNADIVRKIEALGGEVWVAPFTEWIFYTNYRFKEDSLVYRNFGGYLKMSLQDRIQKAQEEFYAGKLDSLNLDLDEAPTEELIAHSRPYIHKSFGGEAILSVGKAIDYVRQGVAGIVNVMPFTCMYGTIVVAISKKLREDFGDVPWLNAAFDGQKDTNLGTRLEAFMHQAKAYQTRHRAKKKTGISHGSR
jgi:predicted nucleotide-binding protein (sugar kinase/HSP70/actin superfamily)